MELIHIGWYQAPPRYVHPRIIPAGHQLVEVITGGEAVFAWDGRENICHCGSILWHIPGEHTVHRNNVRDPYNCITFLFKIQEAGIRPVPRYSHWSEPVEVVKFTQEALTTFNTRDNLQSVFGEYCYNTLRWKAHAHQYIEQEQTVRHSSLESALNAYLEQHPIAEVTVNSLAEAVGISVSYLHQQFHAKLQTTPYQYLLDKKMQHAKLMLATSDSAIGDVGRTCGFSTPESFSRSFKKLHGISPSTYRQQRRPYYGLDTPG